MEADVIICRCQELTKQDVLDAIADGAVTINGVKKRIRSGMGLCQGKTCERLVATIISEETGRPLSELIPPTSRPPVRPIPIRIFAEDTDDEE